MLRKVQDKFEGGFSVAELSLEIRNVVTKDVRDKTNMSANVTLEYEFVQEVNNVLESRMKRCCICDVSKDVTFAHPSCFDFLRCIG